MNEKQKNDLLQKAKTDFGSLSKKEKTFVLKECGKLVSNHFQLLNSKNKKIQNKISEKTGIKFDEWPPIRKIDKTS